MKVPRIFLVASLVLAGTLTFAATVKFALPVSYDSGASGANSVATGDVNGDSFPDIVVATQNGVSVLLNAGDGTFLPPTTFATGGTFSNAVALADVDQDGNLDIVVTNECLDPFNCQGVAVLRGNGDGTFQSAVGYNSGGLETGGLVVGDVNNDGFPDLALVSNCQFQTCAGGTLNLLLNNGDGTFAAFVHLSDSSGPVAMGDVNNDGSMDLVTAAGVMLGHGDGTFDPPNSAVVGGAVFIAVADVNGDGNMDVVTALPKSVAVQLGFGDGTLQPAVTFKTGGFNPLSVAVMDFNGDGKLDLAVANECTTFTSGVCGGTGRVGVLAGKGDGTFVAPVGFASGGRLATSISASDNDQDGKLDLVVANACTSTCSTHGLVATLNNNFTAAVTMKLVSSATKTTLNQPVTFTATLVTAPQVADDSLVDFVDTTTGIDLGSAPTVNGVATLTTAFTTKGVQTVKATFDGDLFHTAAHSVVTETIIADPSTTTVVSDGNPSTYKQPVTLTATVVSNGGPTPTGTVGFRVGSLVLGTANLDGSGVASLVTTNLPRGTDTITATYHGDTQTATSAGTYIQTVN